MALAEAIRAGDLPMMRLLIAHGADVDGKYSVEGRHSRPVEDAIQHGRPEALQLLVQSGARVGAADLLAAARCGKDVGVLRFLLDLGFEYGDDAPLLAAAASSHQSWPILQVLLESPAASVGSASDAGQHGNVGTRLGKALVASAEAGMSKTMGHLLKSQCAWALDSTSSSSGPAHISKEDLTKALHAFEAASRRTRSHVRNDDLNTVVRLCMELMHIENLLTQHGAERQVCDES
jgi:hypothetical protein